MDLVGSTGRESETLAAAHKNGSLFRTTSTKRMTGDSCMDNGDLAASTIQLPQLVTVTGNKDNEAPLNEANFR